MSTFEYKITGFDDKTKALVVEFADGSYAKINLMVPLPENVTDLEAIIKQYVLPQQAIDAETSDVDMSYVKALIGQVRECERRSISPDIQKPADNANIGWDETIPYNGGDELDTMIKDIENETLNSNAEFENAVMAVLVKNGLGNADGCGCSKAGNCCKA